MKQPDVETPVATAEQADDPRLDRINELYRGEIFAEETAATARERIHWMCANAIGPRVLDVGCSQGITSLLLAREGLSVVGIDNFAPAIEYARAELARESTSTLERVRFQLCDIHELGADEVFDCVIAGEVLEHQTNPERFLAALAQHLRPGGRLILTTPFGLHPHDDHKSIILPGPLANALSAFGRIESLDVEKGYLQAILRHDPADRAKPSDEALLALAESGTLIAQRALYAQLDRRGDANRRLKDQLQGQRDKVAALTLKSDQARKRASDAESLLAASRNDVQLGKLRLEQAQQSETRHQSAIKTLEQRLATALTQAERNDAEARSSQQRLQTLTTQLRDGEKLLERERTNAASLQQKLQMQSSANEKTLAAERSQTMSLRSTLTSLNGELAAMRSNAVSLKGELTAMRGSLASQRNEAATVQRTLRVQVDQLQANAKQAIARQQATERELGEQTRVGTTLKHRLQVMESLARRQSLYAEELHNSVSWRLGNAVVEGMMSWRGFLNMPRALASALAAGYRVWRRGQASNPLPPSESVKAKATSAAVVVPALSSTGTPATTAASPAAADCLPQKRSSLSEEEKAAFQATLSRTFEAGGGPAIQDFLEQASRDRPARLRSFVLLKAAQLCHEKQQAEWVTRFGKASLESDPSDSTVRSLARLFWDSGETALATASLEVLERNVGKLSGADLDLSLNIRGRALETIRALVPEKAPAPLFTTEPARVLYFLHNSLPFTSGGYATRSHGIATALRGLGVDLVACTRPGYPKDVPGSIPPSELTPEQVLDGVRYRRIYDIGRRGLSQADYVAASYNLCAGVVGEERPRVVHAASNYLTGLPPLIAARKAGLPFIYEARGFWEITRSSRDPIFKQSDQFKLMRDLETLVATEADHVITLTQAMRDELVTRGVAHDRISIAYNSVDPDRFLPRERDQVLATRLGITEDVPVIGYVGSFVDYEGLDDLISACRILRDRRQEFRLLLVGDGAVFDDLKRQVRSSSLSERVLMTGRVPHEEVESYYSLIDVCPFPRKPWEVCEMVSPLKPFEALAMEKAVVVSGVRALREIIADGVTGRVFESGSVEALADSLQALLGDTATRRTYGTAGRTWVQENRTWRHSATAVLQAYRTLGLELG